VIDKFVPKLDIYSRKLEGKGGIGWIAEDLEK